MQVSPIHFAAKSAKKNADAKFTKQILRPLRSFVSFVFKHFLSLDLYLSSAGFREKKNDKDNEKEGADRVDRVQNSVSVFLFDTCRTNLGRFKQSHRGLFWAAISSPRNVYPQAISRRTL